MYCLPNTDACRVKSVIDLSGEIDSPRLQSGLYPDDADCQWIIQVRGGYQVRLHFLDFDLEYGHDELIIGGTDPDDDEVDSEYLVIYIFIYVYIFMIIYDNISILRLLSCRQFALLFYETVKQ